MLLLADGSIVDVLNRNAGAVQSLANLVLVVVTIVYVGLTGRLARRAKDQLEVTERSARASAMLELVKYLQATEVRDARTRVRAMHRPANWWTEWSDDDLKDVALVCASFDSAAVLVTSKLVAEEPFVTTWGPSMIACFDVCQPYITDMQVQSGFRGYWSNFEVVVDLAKQRVPRLES